MVTLTSTFAAPRGGAAGLRAPRRPAGGYEFEKGKFVLTTADKLKALADNSRQTTDIVAFIPQAAVNPIFRA